MFNNTHYGHYFEFQVFCDYFITNYDSEQSCESRYKKNTRIVFCFQTKFTFAAYLFSRWYHISGAINKHVHSCQAKQKHSVIFASKYIKKQVYKIQEQTPNMNFKYRRSLLESGHYFINDFHKD